VIAGTVVASVGGLTILLLIILMVLRYYRHRRRALDYDGVSSPLHSAANLHNGGGGGGFRGGFSAAAGATYRGGISGPMTGPEAARVAPGSAMELSPPEGALGGRGVIPSTAFFRADRGAAGRSPNRSSSPTLGADSPSPLGGVRSPPGRSKLGGANPFGDDGADETVAHHQQQHHGDALGVGLGFAFSDDQHARRGEARGGDDGEVERGQRAGDLQRQTTDGISLTSVYRDSWPAPDPPPPPVVDATPLPAPLGIRPGANSTTSGGGVGPAPRDRAPDPPADVWPGPLAPRPTTGAGRGGDGGGAGLPLEHPRPYHAAYAAPFGSSPSPSPTDPADIWPGPNAPSAPRAGHAGAAGGPTSGAGGGSPEGQQQQQQQQQQQHESEEEAARRRETLRPSPARTPQIHEGPAADTYPFPERASPMLGWGGPGVGERRLRPGQRGEAEGRGGYGGGFGRGL
jgi:hypothetical protein